MGCGTGGQGCPLRSGGWRLGKRCQPLGHHLPRGQGGTHPSRVSLVRNVETPSRSWHCCCRVSGRWTVREAEFLGGNRMVQEANAGGRKAGGKREDGRRPRRSLV